MKQNIKYANILDKAADLISPPGAWCRGSDVVEHKDGTNAYCAYGAIIKVARNKDVSSNIAAVIENEIRSDYFSITSWNDTQRDKRKVIRLLRRVAKKLRNQ